MQWKPQYKTVVHLMTQKRGRSGQTITGKAYWRRKAARRQVWPFSLHLRRSSWSQFCAGWCRELQGSVCALKEHGSVLMPNSGLGYTAGALRSKIVAQYMSELQRVLSPWGSEKVWTERAASQKAEPNSHLPTCQKYNIVLHSSSPWCDGKPFPFL